MSATLRVLAEVAAERKRQAAKHGDQSGLPDGTSSKGFVLVDLYPHADCNDCVRFEAQQRTEEASDAGELTFEHILTEEWAEAVACDDVHQLRAELIQVAAVAVQWVEALDQRSTEAAAL